MWTSAGGVPGIVDYLAGASVDDLKFFARALAGCRRGAKVSEREQQIEELLRALLPAQYPDSDVQSQDKRPVQAYYAGIARACSSDFVKELLDKKDKSNPVYTKIRPTGLLRSHAELLRERTMDAISLKNPMKDADGHDDNNLKDYLQAFCSRLPMLPGPMPKITAPMAFSMEVLKLRIENREDTFWPHGVTEATIYLNLMGRCLKKRMPKEKIKDMFKLGLELLDSNDKLIDEYRRSAVWNEISTRWGRAPAEWEDLFTYALRLGLGGPATLAYSSVLPLSLKLNLKSDRLWDLLRLYCLHASKHKSNGVLDINTTRDLKPLLPQKWPTELFYALEKDKAILLLENLLESFPNDTILRPPNETSIFGKSFTQSYNSKPPGGVSQKNTEATLLLTLLQRDSPKIQVKAKATVEEFRKKSMTAREQADRAAFALTAIQHAIASGNLDLYGETVIWLQRYVRDTLTLKEVFGRQAVLTVEGIDLLSGIPNPLPENITLDEISVRVEKANIILKSFHETMLIAKREPSYQEYDWERVVDLFGSAIDKRARYAEAFQKRLASSDADMYAAIWGSTLAMLEEMDVRFIKNSIGHIRSIILKLPPTTLTGIAKSMLATGAERRKKADRQPGDDELESLSYAVLLQVAKGDKPELAQPLILETILDRPDASSWHRQFLSISFMKSLTAKKAQEMLLSFATAIGEKLEEQAFVTVGKAKEAPSAPPSSLVKITTVKYLAQLLDNAAYISTDTAVEVLTELFRAGTHRDIRLATLESLLNLLETFCKASDTNWRSSPSVEKIFEAIETVVPVLGSINERRPLSEADWAEAQSSGKLPEVSERNRLPPLMNAIFNAPIRGGLEMLTGEFVKRFLLPAYKLSQEEQLRWTTLFLSKHAPTIKPDDLPPSPVAPHMWIYLIQYYTKHIPYAILEDFNKYTIMTMSHPKPIRELNKRLRKDRELVNTPEVVHWLSLFDRKLQSYRKISYNADEGDGTKILVQLLKDEDLPASSSAVKVPNGLTRRKVSHMLLFQAELILIMYETNPGLWNEFTKDLQCPHDAPDPKYPRDLAYIRERADLWKVTLRPVLEKCKLLLETRKAEFKEQGKLTILPSIDLLNHWLLPYPSYPESEKEEIAQCTTLARKLETNISHALDREGGLLRWPKILDEACTVVNIINTGVERLRVAAVIGKLVEGEGVENVQRRLGLNVVKMGVAMKLMEKAWERKEEWFVDLDVVKKRGGGKAGELKWEKGERGKMMVMGAVLGDVKGMLGEWRFFKDEGVRERVEEWRRENKGFVREVERDEDELEGDESEEVVMEGTFEFSDDSEDEEDDSDF